MRASRLMFLVALSLHSFLLAADPGEKTVLVIHGGAGVLTEAELKDAHFSDDDFKEGLAAALRAGLEARKKGTSVDVVEAAIRVLEDSPYFNAGRGAPFTEDGRVELDAAIMEGDTNGAGGEGKLDPRKRAGAVAAVSHIRNPILAARAVMEKSGHVLLVGEGAESFVFSQSIQATYKIEKVSNTYFWTERRLEPIRKKMLAKPSKGTVGAVALSDDGRLAAGTSTGGLAGKLPGRVGDSPLIGSGTYADDRACGVSCTGTGEVFIRYAVAHDVVARMLYKKDDVELAAKEAIDQLPDEKEGVGGLIALDKSGRHAFAMSANSLGMYRGYVTQSGKNYKIYVAIGAASKFKLIE